MTTSTSVPTTTPRRTAGSRPRRRLATLLLVATLGLGGGGALFGFTTSPGRTGGGVGQDQLAIPGVRGTGGGSSFGVSTSPGATELAVRKAGGTVLEYL